MNVLYLVALGLAGLLAWLGARLGGPGTTGSIVGALVGGALGLAVGFGLVAASAEYLLRRLRKKSVAELRAELRDPAHRTPNLVLSQLKQRGEVSPDDLEVVIAMLEEGDAVRRQRGWLALHGAFHELLNGTPSYRPLASAEERAAAVATIRAAHRARVPGVLRDR
ncbi:MAG: hypothetical protein ABW221_27680 [Vicinamibacteria bacterium]